MSQGATPLFVYGASGMLAGELARLLELHPGFSLEGAVSRSENDLTSVHPHLGGPAFAESGFACKTITAERASAAIERLAGEAPVAVALALPHGESAAAWAGLRGALGSRASEVRVIDLAADYRLRDPERYRATYGGPHPDPEELASFAYGLPELGREELLGAKRVAAPGCFATALQLATVPAARAGLLDTSRPWVLHGVTGSSGSGVLPKPGTHHPHRNGNLWAYALGGHRHEAELEQALERLDLTAPLHFVPHSGPFARGIHLTCALPLVRSCSSDEVRRVFAEAYAGEAFVDVLPDGVPDLRTVVGSNRASLGVSVRGEVLTVLLTLDNMIKGGAGQALQCLNLMFGYPETRGLPRAGLGVI